MGMLLNGVWTDDSDVAAVDPSGEWKRVPAAYRNWIVADRAFERHDALEAGTRDFIAEAARYHLYAAWNCPWAHRALLARVELGLEEVISTSFVAPKRTDQGWVFDRDKGFIDDLFDFDALHQVYTRGSSDYTGRVTVPLLWDRKEETAVSNESADIVRMLNTGFRAFATRDIDLYPTPYRSEIDTWNELIYTTLNNGVYRAGFASTQDAYETAVDGVFQTLDKIERHLGQLEFLVGDRFTEADLRLFPTLVRFDVAYNHAFKCTRNRLMDMPNVWRYARKLYARPGYAQTVHFDVYRRGYNSRSEMRNPLGIIPVAPTIDWSLDEIK